ncbi:ATP-binding cassette domain-containing protein [Rhodospirillales bacterium]|jgi:ATP-binding cassette subfamily C protein LapB|nr:ATP-binding cassette domain-containing protein [Rhodospirillales bacterium]
MRELAHRLFSNPPLFLCILIASTFVNILALASPLFVIQVLNRFVAQGVSATLLTLTTGVLLAILFEFVFRQIRFKLIDAINAKKNFDISIGSYKLLLKAKADLLERVSDGLRSQVITSTEKIVTAYGAGNIALIFDAPFSILFVGVLYFLSPILAFITFFFILAVYLVGLYSAKRNQIISRKLMRENTETNMLVSTACTQIDTVRAFNAFRGLIREWTSLQLRIIKLRRSVETSQVIISTLSQSAMALLSVMIISIGAMCVVDGSLDVGSMIGANILSARALMPIVRLSQLGVTFAAAAEGLRQLNEFTAFPQESEGKSFKKSYTGCIEFKDVSFVYPGSSTPIFESLSFTINPQNITVICGENGTGKSTLAKILVGILSPSRGKMLLDGLDLQQTSLEWWRGQIAYLPQEPSLINTTIKENILMATSKGDEQELATVVRSVGLVRYLDESTDGLETLITNNGSNLSLGIRHRIALARALMSNCKVAVFDEPTDGLDRDGIASVYSILNSLTQQNCAIVIISHDQKIIKNASQIIDLNKKPIPRVTKRAHSTETPPITKTKAS